MINFNNYNIHSFRDNIPEMIVYSKEYKSSWKKLSMSLRNKLNNDIIAYICLNRVDMFPAYGIAGCKIISFYTSNTVDFDETIEILEQFLIHIRMFHLDLYGKNYLFDYVWMKEDVIAHDLIYNVVRNNNHMLLEQVDNNIVTRIIRD